MRIEVLVVPGCPNRSLALERVRRAVVESRCDAAVVERVVRDAVEAQDAGMCGSPTILVDGCDPFPGPGQPSLSCRLYPDGPALAGAPSVRALVEVLSR